MASEHICRFYLLTSFAVLELCFGLGESLDKKIPKFLWSAIGLCHISASRIYLLVSIRCAKSIISSVMGCSCGLTSNASMHASITSVWGMFVYRYLTQRVTNWQQVKTSESGEGVFAIEWTLYDLNNLIAMLVS